MVRDRDLRVLVKTETRCFFTIDDVLFTEDASEAAYEESAVYESVEEDVAAAVPVCVVFVEDILCCEVVCPWVNGRPVGRAWRLRLE